MAVKESSLAKRETDVPMTKLFGALVNETGMTPETLALVMRTVLPAKQQTPETLAKYILTMRSHGLDPMLSGAYAIEMKGGFQLILHYDTMLGIARSTGELEECTGAAFYATDKFSFDPTDPDSLKHEIDWTQRDGKAKPLGAWCRVVRRGCQPVVKVCMYGRYNKEGVWNAYPEIMIEKTAKRQAIREVFGDKLAGIYTPEEVREIRGEQLQVDADEAFLELAEELDGGGETGGIGHPMSGDLFGDAPQPTEHRPNDDD